MTDPIADMLTRIRNAAKARKNEADIPYSRMKFDIAKILEKEGYLAGVSANDTKRTITIKIRYENKESSFRDLQRLSKPGRRVYVGWRDVPRILSGLGITILSTSQGVMTGGEARKRKLGGELICEVY